jgi:rhodanese-related sulfurtransferase
MFQIISVPEASALLEMPEVLFIDVREAWEREQEHIASDRWLPLSALVFEPYMLDYSMLVFYCAAGYRSQNAAERIYQEGLSQTPAVSLNLFSLQDGVWGWKQHHLPLITAKA